jgi:tight adherence protein B
VKEAAAGRAARKYRDDLHLLLSVLGSELEAGSGTIAAVEAGRRTVPRFSADLDSVLTGDDPAEAWRPLAVAWSIAEQTGAPLADVLARVRDDVNAQRQLHRSVAVVVAGARSSAVLLALLPVLGLGLGAAIGAHPLSVLVQTAPGRVLLVAGVVLDALGVLWSSELIRRAQPAEPP